MVEYSKEVEKLAETLKNSGLAASMPDALERAQSMIGKKEEKVREEPVEKKTDAAQTTLGELKDGKEATEPEESPEEEKELKKDEVFSNNPNNETKQRSSNQNRVNYSIVPNSSSRARTKEKKIDLSDIFNVNK